MATNILFLGSRTDPHLQLVGDALADLGSPPVYLDHEETGAVTFSLDEQVFVLRDRSLALHDICLAWNRAKIRYRRFGAGDEFNYQYIWGAGWRAFIDEIGAVLGDRTVNSLAAVRRASDKLVQLFAARDLGFVVPRSLVSNQPKTIRKWASAQERTITKTLGEGFIPSPHTEYGHSTIMTTRVEWPLFDTSTAGVESLPTLYQDEIPKAYELRVAVQGNSIFAFKIDSQAREYTKVDWRFGSPLEIYDNYELPSPIVSKIHQYMSHFGLFSGHFDFVVTPDGEYVFLECNPQGQWAFLDHLTDHRMSRAFAQELLDRAGILSKNPGPETRFSLLGFSLEDCAPCSMVFDNIAMLAPLRNLPVEIVKVARDDSVAMSRASAYEVRFYPSVFLLENGVVIARLQGASTKSGPLNKRNIADWLDRHLSTRPTV